MEIDYTTCAETGMSCTSSYGNKGKVVSGQCDMKGSVCSSHSKVKGN